MPQSAEQVCREVEAADAASVARLVRVVLVLLSQLLEHGRCACTKLNVVMMTL